MLELLLVRQEEVEQEAGLGSVCLGRGRGNKCKKVVTK